MTSSGRVACLSYQTCLLLTNIDLIWGIGTCFFIVYPLNTSIYSTCTWIVKVGAFGIPYWFLELFSGGLNNSVIQNKSQCEFFQRMATLGRIYGCIQKLELCSLWLSTEATTFLRSPYFTVPRVQFLNWLSMDPRPFNIWTTDTGESGILNCESGQYRKVVCWEKSRTRNILTASCYRLCRCVNNVRLCPLAFIES